MSVLRLSSTALATVIREAPRSADGCETGGILLGYDASAENAALVLIAGDPGPKATRRPNFFQRDREHAAKLAAEGWRECRSEWLGEWHTHPGGDLRPSRQDLRLYRSLVHDRELGFSSFYSLIVGSGDGEWSQPRLACWEITRSGPRLLARINVGQVELLHSSCDANIRVAAIAGASKSNKDMTRWLITTPKTRVPQRKPGSAPDGLTRVLELRVGELG